MHKNSTPTVPTWRGKDGLLHQAWQPSINDTDFAEAKAKRADRLLPGGTLPTKHGSNIV